MPIHINDSGTVRTISNIYVNDAGTVRNITDVWINDSGTIRRVFQSGTIIGAGAGQSTFYQWSTALRTTYGAAVLSAGPLSGTRAEGTTGTWEVILAPGYRLTGDTGDTASYTSTYSARYLFDVASDGSATHTAASGAQTTGGTSAMASYSAGTTRINVTEVDITNLDEANFPHVVEWGNSDASNRSSTFTWNPPAGVTSIQVSGIGGGGGGAAGGSTGTGNSATGGGGGGGGAYALNTATSATAFTITLGEGGAGSTKAANNSPNGTRSSSGSSGGTTTVLADGSAFLSLAGGGGGTGGQNWNTVSAGLQATLVNTPSGGNNGGSGGGSNGASGGKGSDLSHAFGTTASENRFISAYGSNYPRWDGFSGSNLSALSTSGGSGSTGSGNGYFFPSDDGLLDGFANGANGGVGGGGGGGGAGFSNGGNGGVVGLRGSGGGGGRGESNGSQGGDGYVKVTWTS
jgi:hypothetical protein